jgi:hypothetical protein
MRLARGATTLLAATFALVMLARPAFADPPPEVRAAATALFDDARRAMQARDYATACPKLEAAERMDPGIGILFNLADCYEHLGRTASAWSSFREVAAEAVNKGQPDREKTARARAIALEPKLTKLRVVVPPEANANGLEVTRDGAAIAPAIWGTPVPVDPGKHTIEVKAPGKQPFRVEVVADQPGGVATVNVAPLVDAPVVSPATPTPNPTSANLAEASPDASTSTRTWQRPVAIAVGAVGLAGLGVGTALGLSAKSSFDQSNENAQCDQSGLCNAAGVSLRQSATSKGTVGTIAFIGGAAFVAGGVVLWLTAPRAPAAVGLAPNGVAVRGSF